MSRAPIAGPGGRLGLTPEGDYRVGLYCAKCLRRHGATTLLAIMSTLHEPGFPWRWGRLARARDTRRLTVFKLPEDADYATGGAELHCHRCGARPRVNLTKLCTAADAVRHAGGSAVNV